MIFKVNIFKLYPSVVAVTAAHQLFSDFVVYTYEPVQKNYLGLTQIQKKKYKNFTRKIYVLISYLRYWDGSYKFDFLSTYCIKFHKVIIRRFYKRSLCQFFYLFSIILFFFILYNLQIGAMKCNDN